MVDIVPGVLNVIDFSFMPSLECNLECPFCMYDAGYDKTERLDMEIASKYMIDIYWDEIRSVGLYGGEPSINIPLYEELIHYIPQYIPLFII